MCVGKVIVFDEAQKLGGQADMSTLISIKHTELYDQISGLNEGLLETMSELDSKYREIKSELKELDSATNAELMNVIEHNQRKVAIEVETLDKLLLFIRNTAEEYETLDNSMSRNFSNMAIISSLK